MRSLRSRSASCRWLRRTTLRTIAPVCSTAAAFRTVRDPAADSSLPAGTTVGLTLTVTNNAPVPRMTPQHARLGRISARLQGSRSTLTPASTGTSDGQYRSRSSFGSLALAPGDSVIVTFDATASCVAPRGQRSCVDDRGGSSRLRSRSSRLTGRGSCPISPVPASSSGTPSRQPPTATRPSRGRPTTPFGVAVAVGAVDALGATISAPSGVTLDEYGGNVHNISRWLLHGVGGPGRRQCDVRDPHEQRVGKRLQAQGVGPVGLGVRPDPGQRPAVQHHVQRQQLSGGSELLGSADGAQQQYPGERHRNGRHLRVPGSRPDVGSG